MELVLLGAPLADVDAFGKAVRRAIATGISKCAMAMAVHRSVRPFGHKRQRSCEIGENLGAMPTALREAVREFNHTQFIQNNLVRARQVIWLS